MDSKEMFKAQMANHQDRPEHVHVPGEPDYTGGALGEVVTRCRECCYPLSVRPSRVGVWAD